MNLIVSSPVFQGNATDLCYCRATLYSALALGFRVPSQETVARLLSQEGAEILAHAAATCRRVGELQNRSLAEADGTLHHSG
jgi:hypothetical protein